MPTSTERAILATISYFDLFSYPLTPQELWKWCIVNPGQTGPTLADILAALKGELLTSRLAEREGMYTLKGREECVDTRKERYLIAERKYQRLSAVMRLFRYLPFLRSVAVCNSLAYGNARDESDLDVLVIAEPRHIWTARMFATGLATLLGWRPMPGDARDTVCLSFYVTTDTSSLQHLTLSHDDLYFRFWLDQLTPIYGDGAVIDTLRTANGWYRDRLPNAQTSTSSWRRHTPDSAMSRGIKSLLEKMHAGYLGQRLERRYEAWQRAHLPSRLQELANKDTRVILNDGMLKFHENDRRGEFQERYAARVQEVLSS